jgi:ribosomal protein S27E
VSDTHISMSCGACGHLTTFDRTSKEELRCAKCGRPLGLSGMSP